MCIIYAFSPSDVVLTFPVVLISLSLKNKKGWSGLKWLGEQVPGFQCWSFILLCFCWRTDIKSFSQLKLNRGLSMQQSTDEKYATNKNRYILGNCLCQLPCMKTANADNCQKIALELAMLGAKFLIVVLPNSTQQNRTEPNNTEQNETKQNKTTQNKATQDKTNQNKPQMSVSAQVHTSSSCLR